MEKFNFHASTNIFFGKNQIENLPNIVNQYGHNILLTYGGGSIKRNGIYDKIHELLKDFNIIELAGIEPNPRIGTVRNGVKLCKENKIDLIIAAGGGSTIDCSKVIAAATYYEGDSWDLVKDSSKIDKSLPLISILTLAATGSEMNGNAVISNPETNEKLGTSSSALKPVASILDPEYTYTLPAIQTAAGSADIMSHVIENYFGDENDCYLQNQFSEGILKTCIKYTPIALGDPTNYEARSNLMWSSSMALCGLCSSGKKHSWSCHPIEHELSAFYDITHGVGLAIITPHWMRHILSEKTVDKFVDYAVNVWGIQISDNKFETANKGIDATEKFFKDCGIPMNLGKLGINDMLLEKMAKAVIAHKDLTKAYVPLNEHDILEILRKSL